MLCNILLVGCPQLLLLYFFCLASGGRRAYYIRQVFLLVKNVFYNIIVLYDNEKLYTGLEINIDKLSTNVNRPIKLLSINEKLKPISTLCLKIGTKLIITIHN